PVAPRAPVRPFAPEATVDSVGPASPDSTLLPAASHALSPLMSSLSGPVVMSQPPLPLRSQQASPSGPVGPLAPVAPVSPVAPVGSGGRRVGDGCSGRGRPPAAVVAAGTVSPAPPPG